MITTKAGQFNQPIHIEFNDNLTVGQKPDLNYIRQMSPADFIDVERELFGRGFYTGKLNSNSRPIVSPVADMLDKIDKGIMTKDTAAREIARLRTVDARDQFNRYMYRPSCKQQ